MVTAVDPDDVSFQNGTFSNNNEAVPSSALAKDKLVNVLRVMTNEEPQLEQIQESIMQLESLNATPITPEFTEMALAGSWSLLFSSVRIRSKQGVRIRDLSQRFDIAEKRLMNVVSWSFPDKLGVESVDADMTITCKYLFVGPGRLQIDLEGHNMSLRERSDGKPNDLPDDLPQIISDLRATLPFEFFDPSGLCDITYIEPDFRVARFIGKRTAGIRNVFTRTS